MTVMQVQYDSAASQCDWVLSASSMVAAASCCAVCALALARVDIALGITSAAHVFKHTFV